MDVRWMSVVLDSPAADGEAFWRAAIGSAGGGDAYVRVRGAGAPARTQVGFHVVGVPEAAREAVALGATLIGEGVVRSPAGVEFRMVPWRGEKVRPGPVRWPGGQRSLLDQVCLDVPAALVDAEVAFWHGLTGWEVVPSDLPEFWHLRRQAGLPVKLLVQRVGSGVAGVHPDFACDGVDAEVERHVGLGAQVVRRVPGDWTTLRDPVGREYCVTGRSPVAG